MEKYDLIIVGAGPAGIFTAVELLRRSSKKKILLVEKGKPVEKRHCPKAELGHCVNCRPTCAITTGFSGAGAFSDGKLSLSYEVGGDLPSLIGEEFAQELIDYTDKIYLEFGADPHVEGIYTGEEIKEIRKNAIHAGLKLVDCPIRHLGTEKAQQLYLAIQNYLADNGVEMLFSTECENIILEDEVCKGVYLRAGSDSEPRAVYADTVVIGTGRRGAAQHSQNMESLFAHIPGLKLVCPSTPEDAKGLLKTAIRDDDPVVFLEHKLLYPQKVETPDEVAPIPLGSARTRREGTDLTILTWARQVNFSLEAAETLAADGVSAEVIDLRSLVPLDWDAIRDSVSKTHRVLIVEEDVKRCGFGAELSAQITEDLFDQLDAPVRRVAALNSSVPFCAELEDEIYPNPERIAAAAAALVRE